MNYYSLSQNDQPHSSWVIHEVLKKLPKREKKPELGTAFYKFFGPGDAEVRMKPEYQRFCCKKCGRYDCNDMFEVGFKDPVHIRIKGDFAELEGGFLVVSERFLSVLQKAKVNGFEAAPAGSSGWHVLRINTMVDCVDGVVKVRGATCPECRRRKHAFGIFEHLNELSPPAQPNTFFTTKKSWPRDFSNRDIFLTEEVVQTLKQGGIKGGYCTRLLTDEESEKIKSKAKQGVTWKPPGLTVYLSGKYRQ